MQLVIDASATAPLVLGDEHEQVIPETVEAIADGRCIVPGNWPWEMANVVWKANRTKRVEASEVEAIREALVTFEIPVDSASSSAAWAKTLDLAIKYGLTAYDAAYLELAMRLGAALASYDAQLRKAALDESLIVFPN